MMNYMGNCKQIMAFFIAMIFVLSFADTKTLPIGIFILMVGLIINVKQVGYSFKTNSKKNLDYRSEGILDIYSGKGKYRNYIPQGFSITDDSIYFSAYHKFETSLNDNGYDETKPSRVFKVDGKSGKLVKVYTLIQQSIGAHVGGLAVIDGTTKFFVSDGSKLMLYDMDKSDKLGNLDSTSLTTYSLTSNCIDGTTVSFMYWDVSRKLLWVGNWAQKSKQKVCAIRVNVSGDTVTLGDTVKSWTLPVDSVQGIAVKPNSKDPNAKKPEIYLSTSYGSADSIIWKWQPGRVFFLTGPWSVAEGWRGLQNMDFDNGKLWAITEAGANYYQKRTENPWPPHKGYIYADIDI